ncbi:uncharacterized protein LOC144065696 isoform X2 [Stigmatopora argus]
MGAQTLAVLLGTVTFCVAIRASDYICEDLRSQNETSVNVPLLMTLADSFVEELNDSSSQQHQILEAQVLSMCDFIYTKACRKNFINSTLIGFSPKKGHTQAEVVLKFGSTSADQIPQDEVVENLLIHVVNNSGNPFKFTIFTDSVKVISQSESTTPGPVTVSMTQPAVTLEATLGEPFVEELNNRSSEQYIELESQVVTMCDFIFFQAFGPIFIRTIVLGFRPQVGNTQVEVELEFNNSVPIEVIPVPEEVVYTLVEAVNSGNNSFTLTVDPDSIAVISPTPTTTQGPTSSLALRATTLGSVSPKTQRTTDLALVSEPLVTLEATLGEPFVEELNNRSSEQYIELESQVVTMCDFIFLQAFGSIFIRTIVLGFRPQMGNTQVEVELEFNNSVPIEVIPVPEVVVDTLVEAVKSGNNSFTLTVDSDSIVVISLTPTTTQRPTSSLALRATTLGSVSQKTQRTTDLALVSEPLVPLEATLGEPFVEELNNRSSEKYIELESQVVTMCDFIFFQAFGSIFIRTIVLGFRPQMGNTQVEVELEFNNSVPTEVIPDPELVVDTLVEAVKSGNNSFTLTVDPDSIAVISSRTTHGPTSATTRRTTDISVPSLVVPLEASLVVPFVEELNNRSSEQYIALESQVVTMCDFIFFQTFGSIFIRTIVLGFSPQMGNTQVEVKLEFNNSVPTEVIPDRELVVDTLVEAVKSGNNSFNLTVDPDSIALISATPTTTQGPTSSLALRTTTLGSVSQNTQRTTDLALVSEPLVTLEATLGEPFVEELNNRSSEQYIELESQVVTMCDFIFFQAFGSIFIRTIVLGFRPQMGNTQVEVELEFNNSVPIEVIPVPEEVVYTLVEAVKSGNNSFNLTVDPDSIAVISPTPTTTQGPTSSLALRATTLGSVSPKTQRTTDLALVSEPLVILEATLGEPFVEELNNRSSEQYIELESQVVTMCDFIFFQAFGSIFIRTIVLGFRPQMGNTQVEVELEFNNSVPIEVIPVPEEVVDTLVEAVKSGNNSFNLTVDPDSIAVISPTPTTTQGPTSSLALRATTLGSVSPKSQRTTDLALVSEPLVILEATLGEPFVEELNNRSSEKYIELESQVVTMCDLIFLQAFGSIFIQTIVLGFRPQMGNTQVEVELEFNNSVPTEVIPDPELVVDTLVEAVKSGNNSFTLTVDPDSIAVISPTPTTTQRPTSSLALRATTLGSVSPKTQRTTHLALISETIVTLEATLGEPFAEELNNRSSEQYIELETQVVTMCDFIFLQAFGSIFIQTIVLGFRPEMGNTQVEVELEFNNSVPIEVIPVPEEVVDTLVEAVKSGNNSFTLTVDPDSIAVISLTPTTTQGPTSSLALRATTLGSVSPKTQRTTDLALISETIVTLEATIGEPFVEELNNRSSEQYIELESQVVTMCDFIFFQAFGSIFIRTIVLGFRPQMGNTQVEVELEFNNSVPIEVIPVPEEVVDTLVEAVKSGNNSFTLTVDPDSIAVISLTPTTTQGPTSSLALRATTLGSVSPKTQRTTDLALVSEPLVTLEATLGEPFVEELNNRSSEQYIELESQVVTMCDFIFFQAFGSIFIRTIVLGFRPEMGNTQVEVELEFNNSVPIEVIPVPEEVVGTLVEAVKSGNNSFTLTVDPDSIAVISLTPTTTQRPTSSLALRATTLGSVSPKTQRTTHLALISETIVTLEATLGEPFVEELNNRSSEQYIELETQVVTMCDFIFFQAFGSIFIRTIVLGFRPQMGNTQVEVELEFNNSVAIEIIPVPEVVIDTLVEALKSGNNSFNLTVDPESIVVISPTPTTTQGPTSSLALRATTLGSVSPKTQRTTDLALVSEPLVTLEATLGEPFVEQLNNRSSEQYIELESQVVTMCDFIFFQAFGSIFIQTIVLGFRPQMGNTQVEVELEFNNSVPTEVIPDPELVVDTLVEAVKSGNNSFTLTVDPDSIAVIASRTTHGPTSATTRRATDIPVPSPVVPLEASLVVPFVEELNNRSSEQYIALESQVVTMCDFIFFQAFGSIFIQTIVLGFRPQMGNTQVEVELEFNNSVPTEVIPDPEMVVDTLVEAVKNGNNSFTLTVDPDSIAVISSRTTHGPTSATTRRTTDIPVPSPVVPLEASLVVPFVEELNNRSSEQFIELESQVVTMCDFILLQEFGTLFLRTIVIGFSPNEENTQVELDLEFNSSAPTHQIPEAQVVVETLIKAVNSSNNMFPLSVDPDSIAVISKEATTHAPSPTHGPTGRPTTTLVPATHGPTTTHATVTDGPTTSHASASKRPTTSHISATHGPMTTHLPATDGPTTTHVSATKGLTTTHVPATKGPTTTHVALTDGLTTSHASASKRPTIIHVSATHGPMTTHFPATSGPTTTHVAVTDGPTTRHASASKRPTTSHISATHGPMTTHLPATDGPTTTHVSATKGPTTSHAPTSKRPTTSLISATHGPMTTHLPATGGPTTTHVSATKGLTTTHVPATKGPTTTHVSATKGLTTTHVPATKGPTTTHVGVTDGPTTSHASASKRPTTSFISATHGLMTTHLPATGGPTTTHVSATKGLTTTHVPATKGPTTTHVGVTDGPTTSHASASKRPTTSHISATHGPMTTQLPATGGPTTTHVAVTDGPTTTHASASKRPTTSHISATHGPMTTHLPATGGPTTSHASATKGLTTTHVPATKGPTTTHVAVTDGPTTSHAPTSKRPTTSLISATHGSMTTHLPATGGPTTTHVSATKGPTTTHVALTDGPTTSHAPTSKRLTTRHISATHGPMTTHLPATGGPTTSHAPASKRPTTTNNPASKRVTTHAPSTLRPSATLAPATVVSLTATLEEPFVEEFNDVNSAEYRALELQVVTACDAIYRERFFLIFIRTFVIRITRAVVVTRMDNTQVDVGVQFKNISSTPIGEVVVRTLQESLLQPDNPFNISILADTIQVIQRTNSTTAKPNTMAAQATMTGNVNSPAAATEALTLRTLRFSSVGETFTSDLLDQSSDAFAARAGLIRTILEPLFAITFSAFKDLRVTSFSNGSIINNMDLRFTSGSVPANNVIANVLINAAQNITAFNVDTSSIFVEGIEFSSGTSQKASFITASAVVLLSWVLSSLQ